MRILTVLLYLGCSSLPIHAQKTENLFLITFDGLRWQELFSGADSLLVDDSGYVEDPEKLTERFWRDDPSVRREALLPFFWNVIAKEGQIYGNRWYGNQVDCTNAMWFSYPGYNEILCGFADDKRINSNKKMDNHNVTVLEFIHAQRGFRGSVAAFCSWDVFPYIINSQRSGIPVNAGFMPAGAIALTDREKLLNRLQNEIRGPWGSVRLDPFTHHFAMEYIKKNKPRVVYIAYGETDDFAHDGRYDEYLFATLQTDQYIKALWEYVQSQEQYRDKTTFLITTDHGRGTHPKENWRHHGSNTDGSGQVWVAAMGPDTQPKGEIKTEGQHYLNQVAATAAGLLGLEYTNTPDPGKKIDGILDR